MNAPEKSVISKTQRALLRLARADMVFYIMPPLMLVLIAGTLAQRWVGLFDAHHIFFASFIIWAGPVPLPGGYLLLSILSINLTLKFLLQSDWTRTKAGIHLTHLGALILLIGGLLTALYAREGYMLIPEGQESPYVHDYTQRELMIFKDDMLQRTIPFDDFKTKNARFVALPFNINVLGFCDNCEIIKRSDAVEQFRGSMPHSFAQFMALTPKPREKEPEKDLSGLSLNITGLDEDQNGLYIAFDAMPKPIELTHNTVNYKIIFGKAQRPLPFSIKLEDFKKETYPGLDKAKAYSSRVIVKDKALQWPVLIEMNKPLRYKGYTFYQSSFEQSETGEATILSVVENHGRLLPYVGTAIITLGLLLHIFITIRRRKSS